MTKLEQLKDTYAAYIRNELEGVEIGILLEKYTDTVDCEHCVAYHTKYCTDNITCMDSIKAWYREGGSNGNNN